MSVDEPGARRGSTLARPVWDDQLVDLSRARRSPPALVTSVAFGVIGAVLLVIGVVADNEPLVLSAVGAGTVSLIAVLVWREQLIAAWRSRRRPG